MLDANDVCYIAEQLDKHGVVKRPYLGMDIVDVERIDKSKATPNGGVKGDKEEKDRFTVLVENIDPLSPAGKAGIRR